MWTQRIRLGKNVNSIQRIPFQEQRYPKKECGKGSLAQREFLLPEVRRQMSIRRAEVCMLWRSTGVQSAAWSVCFSNKLPGDLIEWPLRSFPNLRLWPLINTCTFSPTQTPFPLTSRCGPVAVSYKSVLRNFTNEAKVQHKWHVVTSPPQRNRTG